LPPWGGTLIRFLAAALLVALVASVAVSTSLAANRDRIPQGPVEPAGDVYGWEDEHGIHRYTSDLGRIPAAARARARRILRDPETGVARSIPLLPEPMLARATGPGAAGSEEPAPEPRLAMAARPAAAPSTALPPVSSPAPNGSWAIQLEATEVSGWLRPLDDLGLLDGRRLYRMPTEIGGQPWERLRLGFFPSLAAAQQAARRLRPHFPGAWVDAANPPERLASARLAIEAPLPLDAGPLASAPDDGGRTWVIQLDARPADGRLRAVTRLELLDRHRLYRHTVESKGVVWERLRLGDFTSLEAARNVLSELESSYPDAWIDRSEGPIDGSDHGEG